ncbi:YbaK/EbsC family protein [Clostridium tyrobutyricum]|jgi:Cys-tRNA(Pro) deacylase|uniref:YbaK/EbsC family protein n=1 Tax=Clostridium tyrobutyricum TaxID=1519 RepID=UPI00057E0808|nr:YbaK/EbsC family protein [Clostridium tyrobutyricum]MBR9647744.1 YbaK/EbsC family protein [Clostridium tyrobutyricum]MBV4416042.1 YbaK/EbsC family protein [Clostridium tyrobutyricum]MBV4439991.1 YbaK/EbsC family protein [Clostridium tyrobutyricum]MBV4449357.1 YbaK/EbsC family protein [Clostridium tyrobutyricum]MCH4201002.1 YbaK/EbsC family protein [Clostridium tyrobutyricum]
MSVESVIKYFSDRNIENPVFKLNTSGATVEQAAETIHTQPKYIAKTLAFKLKNEDILIVVRGDFKVSNRKFKDFFGVKARMVDSDKVLNEIGHPIGGLCPFGLQNEVKVYIDVSIKDFEYVYPAAGSKDYALKISPKQIQELVNAKWIDVCKNSQ